MRKRKKREEEKENVKQLVGARQNAVDYQRSEWKHEKMGEPLAIRVKKWDLSMSWLLTKATPMLQP